MHRASIMKEMFSAPPPLVHNQYETVRELFARNVVPSYGRFELVLSHGTGSYVFDVAGKRYLDLGSGIAVCCLGHAHPAITGALVEQSQKLIHVSNLYFTEPQGRLAAEIIRRIGPGKCFFANSGAEANEGLYKIARKFGHDEGRFEILTATNSFHGRTLAGIAATGQDKVKKGFEPTMTGFRHIPYNDLAAARNALSPATVAILIEGVQGEGGVTPATPEYLLGLRALCDEKKLLLLMAVSNAATSEPEGSKVSNVFWRGFRAATCFCRMASRWPSPWAAAFRLARFGCGHPTRICWDRVRMRPRSVAPRWPAP